MDGSGGSHHVGAPRTLDVQQYANARSLELHSLYAVLKNGEKGISGSIPRHLRRRTTSHNRRRSFYWQRKQSRKTGSVDTGQSRLQQPAAGDTGGMERTEVGSQGTMDRRLCRRVRRRIELKGGEDGGWSCASDGTQRLVTHVWHAKRFSMTKLWGYWLAEGLPGRGRGSRAVMRWVKDAAVLQDSCFYSPIELQGNLEALLGALCLVLESSPPSASAMSVDAEAELHGSRYGKAILHHMGRFPHGAIAPVTLIWRPASTEVQRQQRSAMLAAEERQVWVWVHAAAFDEALFCLLAACQRQSATERGLVTCRSRRGELGRLDLLGSSALTILQKVLYTVTRHAEQEGRVEKADITSSCSSASRQLPAGLLDKASGLPGGAVLGMVVGDPRDPPYKQIKFHPSLPVGVDGSNEEVPSKESETGDANLLSWCDGQMSDSPRLWASQFSPGGQRRVEDAISEKELSNKRHKERLRYFQLNKVAVHPQEEVEDVKEDSSCPILLLKHEHQRLSGCGWSLIMPLAWVRAFWVPLVFAGGHVIGLRERHWLSTDVELLPTPAGLLSAGNVPNLGLAFLWKAGLPSFPHDFPDCSAYRQYIAGQAAEFQETYNRTPPSKRSLHPTLPQLWKFNHDERLPGSGGGSIEEGVTHTTILDVDESDAVMSSPTDAATTSRDPLDLPTSINSPAMEIVAERLVDSSTAPRDCVELVLEMDVEQISHEEEDSAQRNSEVTNQHDVHLPLEPQQTTMDHAGSNMGSNAAANTSSVSLILDDSLTPGATEKIVDKRSSPSELGKVEDVDPTSVSTGNIEDSVMFVARTRTTLRKVLRDCNLNHLPICLEAAGGGIMNAFGDFMLAWRPMASASMETANMKGCLVRVLIRAPRKGAFDVGAVIYLPLPSDLDAYLCSSKRWQGFEDVAFKQIPQHGLNNKKRRREKNKSLRPLQPGADGSHLPSIELETVSKPVLPESTRECDQPCSMRRPVGIVTSPLPRGSVSTSAIGICEVANLGILRAGQMVDKRWQMTSEIFLLARDARSSMYRPALASIVLEHGDDL